MTSDATVTLSHLSIGYNEKHGSKTVVLSDICATIHKGELTCLIGANGVGKSTLLRTLANFQPKLAGDIFINGRELDTFTAKELATVIGVVLTEKPDVVNMTVNDMVLMGRSPYTGFWGGYTDEDERVAKQAVDMVGINQLVGRRVSTLSDGERQKVMIAKALAQETPIVYLDEPTAFLDYPSKVEIMRLLRRIGKEALKTVFLSTHDLELALQMADTIWLMDKRNGIHTGAPEDLAIDGILPTFFAGRGVTFDFSIGMFRAENAIVGKVGLIGVGGIRQAMVKKALLRNGIVCDESMTDRMIEVKEDKFVYHNGNAALDVPNIALLLKHVTAGLPRP